MQITDKRCWVEIDLSIIKQNYNIYKQSLPINTKIMAVVKANAYGHGDTQIAGLMQESGVSDFAVATIEEGIKLRRAGIKGQILILGYTPVSSAKELVQYDITQAVVDELHAESLSKISKDIKVSFAIDTGMNRIGLDANNLDYCETVIRKYYQKLNITGLFTHLCVADEFDSESIAFTKKQINEFNSLSEKLKDLSLPYIHCLNSAGGLWRQCKYSDFVRLGIILYGLKPSYTNTLPIGIKTALSWYSVVSMVKTVFPGETIGYGRLYKADKQIRVATVCVGYADGYNRLLSNNFYVLINGCKAAIVGRICMDQIMVDVSDIQNVEMGTKVTLIGSDGNENITADDMANTIGTIGYEIVCNISNRVQKKYI